MSESNKKIETLLADAAQTGWGKVLAVAAAIAAAYYFLLAGDTSGLRENIATEAKNKIQLEQELASTRKAVANADRFEQQVHEMQENFKKIVEFMPETTSTADLISLVSDLSTQAGTRVMSSAPKFVKERGDFYDTVRLSFEIDGTFTQIVSFLSNLSRSDRLFTFAGAKIDNAGRSDAEAPRLVFTGTLVAYKYFAPKTETDDKKDGKADPSAVKGANAK